MTAPKLSDAQRLSWLQLIRSENVGPATFRDLINVYGSAARALEALPEIGKRAGKTLRPQTRDAAIEEMEMARKAGIRFVANGEADYPRALTALDLPPPLLAVRGGSPALFSRPAIALVGSRNASAAGCRLASQMAGECGRSGLVIVSGLARGIDAASHVGSLSSGTIAVLAGGHFHIYPPEHDRLADEIVEKGGALVSEMPLGWQPRAQEFLRRNRLIAGIAHAVVVIEAAARSGALSTARHANQAGRLVMAVPGFPLDPRSDGTNTLLRNGAILVRSARDILDDLAPMTGGTRQPGLFEADAPFMADAPLMIDEHDDRVPEPVEDLRDLVLNALAKTPVHVDELVRATGSSAREVQAVLLELDLAGDLSRHPGGLVSRF